MDSIHFDFKNILQKCHLFPGHAEFAKFITIPLLFIMKGIFWMLLEVVHAPVVEVSVEAIQSIHVFSS